jgi:thiol-disulfide isomerase/thioredoxin
MIELNPRRPHRATLAPLLLALALGACGGGGAGADAPTTANPQARAVATAGRPSEAAAPRSTPAETPVRAKIADFELVAYQGEEVFGGKSGRFSEVFKQGKPVVLNFWGGQCPPCRDEMPAFQRVADEFAGKVLFIGVDVGPFTGLGTHKDARKLLRELGIRYPTAYATTPQPLRAHEVFDLPTTVFFDARGNVVGKASTMLWVDQLRDTVRQLVS